MKKRLLTTLMFLVLLAVWWFGIVHSIDMLLIEKIGRSLWALPIEMFRTQFVLWVFSWIFVSTILLGLFDLSLKATHWILDSANTNRI